ncbi:MAG: trypsin-like peptidase domain-containing protein [Candidatus Poribacteria bacterium]|nr:trypsin-like peptidase domain-containing protein [Candidatus Poribacteria bacterium]
MYKRLFCLICAFVVLTLTSTQYAIADYRITNGSATEPAFVVYSRWLPANGNWPEGWRTNGYYRIEPGGTRNLSIPQGNAWVYIYVQRGGSEIKPTDHATRDSAPFWIHPSEAFTVVETTEGDFLKSNRGRWSLETATLYEYRNGGSHTIPDEPRLPDLTARQIYNQAMNSVVWIYNVYEEAEGSGVLIDRERKLVVTNQHVTNLSNWVFVYSPVPDPNSENGELIGDRDYYVENYEALERTGYATWGRVIAENANRDLAILQLHSLPGIARQINHNLGADLSRKVRRKDPVHILGNPGKLDLWRWTLGLFQSDTGDWLHIDADIFGGNSGGPVLNEQGKLIGIVARSDERTTASAVPVRYVKVLLDTVGPKHTFRIINDAGLTVPYQIKWSSNHNWEQQSLNQGASLYYWWNGETVASGYPKIRFDEIVNDGRFTERIYRLDTFLRYFGNNYKNHVSVDDAYTYTFSYNQWTRKINLSRDTLAAPSLVKAIPKETVLLTNYPNPFNPETWIPYQLAKPAEVTVTIYAADGKLVRRLALGHQPAGVYQSKSRAAYWDGKNDVGESVASGLYFYTLKAGEFTATRKMLIRK